MVFYQLCFLFLLSQWTFGQWAASWQRCCKENLFLKAVTVSFHLVDPQALNSYKTKMLLLFNLISFLLYLFDSYLSLNTSSSDLDQLTEIMKLIGTPSQEFISKLDSEDVSSKNV